MRVKIWGARGSLPTPRSPEENRKKIFSLVDRAIRAGIQSTTDFRAWLLERTPDQVSGYGGNTTCVEVSDEHTSIIIDGGSALRLLGNEMMTGAAGEGKAEVHLFITHFHWDHLIGLPFFSPIFVKGNTIHVYSVQTETEAAFRMVFKKPFFPVPYEFLGAKFVYHTLEPRKPVTIGEFKITPYQLDHPDPCWGFRFDHQGKSYAHCVDTECTRVTREQLGADLPFYQNLDLMVFDAQYTTTEANEHVNWGHASANRGVEIALRESVKKVLFVHHDPASSDEKIFQNETQTFDYIQKCRKNDPTLPNIEWSFAVEGTEVNL